MTAHDPRVAVRPRPQRPVQIGTRIRPLLGSLVVVAALLAGGSAQAQPPPGWNHDPADAASGPGGWAALDPAYEACGSGVSQSPVDVVATSRADLPSLRLDYPRVPVVVENTGHVVEVPMPADGAAPTLRIGPDSYRLVQFHFHAPSEHLLRGRRFPMEVHLVHRDAAGRLAVVGVLLTTALAPHRLVEDIFAAAPQESGERIDTSGTASAVALLPRTAHRRGATSAVVDRYLTYTGSLTTPPCSEGVRWIVLPDPIGVSAATVSDAHDLVAAFPGYAGFADNSRPVQPTNGRPVVRNDD